MLALIAVVCLAQTEAPPLAPARDAGAPAADVAPPPPPPAPLETIALEAVAPAAEPSSPPASPEAVAPPPGEPAEVRLVTSFIDRHLLAVDVGFTGLKVRSGDRTWTLGDTPSRAFRLVPDAVHLAELAEHDCAIAKVLQLTSLSLSGGALGATLVVGLLTLSPLIVVGVMVVSLVALAAALVLSLVGLPIAQRAQERFVQAVAVHNRGLLELRPPPEPLLRALPTAPGLVVPLP